MHWIWNLSEKVETGIEADGDKEVDGDETYSLIRGNLLHAIKEQKNHKPPGLNGISTEH